MAPEMEERFQTLQEIVKAARQNLAPGPWDYLAGGAESETTLRRNRRRSLAGSPAASSGACRLEPRGTTTLPDGDIRMPVMLAPHRLDRASTRGGASSAKSRGVRHPADAEPRCCNPGLKRWPRRPSDNFRIQLYVRGDDAWATTNVVARPR
jgi:glycolate oxidase